MGRGVLAAMLLLTAGTACQATGFRAAPTGQPFTCARNPITRVSLAAPQLAQCCDGKLQCPQFLATTTLVRPKHDSHT